MIAPVAKPLSPTRYRAEAQLHTRISGDGDTIRLSGPLLTTVAAASRRRELIARLFSIPELQGAAVRARLGVLTLRFSKDGFGRSELLEALAAAMHQQTPAPLPFPNEHLLSHPEFRNRFEVHRAGQKLTLWRIFSEAPGRLVLCHSFLRRDEIRAAVLEAILSLPGVNSAFSQRFWQIHLTCDNRLRISDLLDTLESALGPAVTLVKRAKSLSSLQPVIVRTNLALAPIADFIFPPLGLFNAAAVVLLSARHVRPALNRLAQGRANLDLLYTCLAGCALTTFTFLPHALMYWLIPFWVQLAKRVRRESELNFLARFRRRPRRARVEQEGKAIEVNLLQLQPGDLLVLEKGDTVPADGVIVKGRAEVEEWLLTGSQDPVKKTKGSIIYATGRVLDGNIRVQISSAYGHTAADQLLELYEQALNRPKTSSLSSRFAELTVLPVLLLGAAALGRGGLHMAKAVIRPDYLSGPAIVEELGDFWVIVRAAQAGILISDPGVLNRVLKADYWLFDETVLWHYKGGPDSLTINAEGSGLQIVLLASRADGRTAELARKLGWRVVEAGSSAAKRTFIAQRQVDGDTVVYFGSCEKEQEIASEADIAITVADGVKKMNANAPITFLSPDLDKFRTLHSIGKVRTAAIKGAFTTTTLPNLAAIIAAIYLNSSPLLSVLFTTLGAAACYRQAKRLLRQTAEVMPANGSE